MRGVEDVDEAIVSLDFEVGDCGFLLCDGADADVAFAGDVDEDAVVDRELVECSTVPFALPARNEPIFPRVGPETVLTLSEGDVVVLPVPGFAFGWGFRSVVRVNEPAASDVLAVAVFVVVESDGVDRDTVFLSEVLDDSLCTGV